MNRFTRLHAFIDSIALDPPLHVQYVGDSTYEPDFEESYLRVFLGPSIEKTVGFGCNCITTLKCESTIEIVTKGQAGLQYAVEIEDKIRCAVEVWPDEYPGLYFERNAVTTDPAHVENVSRTVLPVNVKYKIDECGECNA